MAEIHSFPIQASDEAIKCSKANLKSASEAGEDLGSRVARVHGLVGMLERTLVVLDGEVDGLRTTLSLGEADVRLRDSGVEAMRNQLRGLIRNARSFSHLDQE